MSTMHRRLTLAGASLSALLMGPVLANAQSNSLLNPSFEQATISQGWFGVSNWSAAEQWGGEVVTTNDARNGTNVMRMNAFGTTHHLLNQDIPVTGGRIYEADGWLRTFGNGNNFHPTNGYCTVLMRFYDSSSTIIAGGNCDTVHFVSNGPTNWTKYTTGPCQAPAAAITGRVTCFYYSGSDATTNGYVLFDDTHAFTSAATRAGALYNPDFEVQPFGAFASIPYWTAFGNAGGVITNAARNGRSSLQIYYTENLLGQTWAATAGARYASSGYMMKTNGITTTNNAHGVILLQYLNAAGTVLQTFESPYLTKTNATNAWIFGEANGVAPVGTVTGRTMCSVLGSDSAFSGAVFFDDVSQRSVASTDTVAGLLHNPGFDDGASGNAYDLDIASAFPHWQWLGGTNAGYVTDSYKSDGIQSLAITYPGNMAAQRAAVVSGNNYVLEGYMSSPVGQAISNNAYGVFFMEFYSTSYKGGTSLVSVVESPHFTSNYTAGTWYKFSVTNWAPWTGSVTCRVLTAVMGNTTNYGGAVYFDGLSLSVTGGVPGNSQSGALWNPGFEYTANGTILARIDNWEGLGEAGNVDKSYSRSGSQSLKIYASETLLAQSWPALPNNRYSSRAYAYTPSGADRFTSPTNAHGVVLLQYLNSTGTVITTYESPFFTNNTAAGVWSNLYVDGIAPAGTVSGRTLVAILGTNIGYSGAIWFDDASQSTVSMGSTQSGVIYNGGFDDGIIGDAFFLSNSLPNWKWLGGSNAGFIVSGVAQSNSQSLTIVYPGNLAGQDFAATTGLIYTAEGYLYTPSASRMTGTTAYATILLEFFNSKGGTTSVSVVNSISLTNGSPSNTWIKVGVTNRAPWAGTWVTGRVSCALLGTAANFGGQVYFDSVRVSVTTSALANTQSGALSNPGFEFTSDGTKFEYIDSWTNFGNAGNIDSLYTQTGTRALKIYYPGQLLLQSWPVSVGYTYTNAAYAYTPSSGADKFTGGTNTYGLVVMEFLDATGTNIASFPSAWFRPSDPAGTWTKLAVTGKAPVGAVSARTMVGLLGWTTGFSGSVWFDDVTQGTMATGGVTQSGVIYNGGFEDGSVGDCFYLSNSLPNWKWLGGSNAGFIVSGVAQSNSQSLTIVYPGNLAGQDFAATTGLIYTAEGYLYTPSTARMTGTTAYATILLEFFNSKGGTTSVSVVNSISLTNGSPSNTWIKVGVTNRAPWAGTWVTGRVSCALLGTAANYGGQVYFDSVRVVVTTSALANTQSGEIENPGFEYTSDGTKFEYIDSWTNFGNAGNIDSLYTHGGSARSLKIYYPGQLLLQTWPATVGYTYTNTAFAYTPTGADRFSGGTNTYGLLVMEFLDATGTNAVGSFPSAWFRTTNAAATWTALAVTGKAPVGTVSARTMVAMLGSTTAFSGALWFDDVTQGTMATGGVTQSGVIYNGGFEDGSVGDCFYLSNNLPNWKWFGGSNAGFIVSGVAQSNSQSLTIVYPGNLAGQYFDAKTGLTYAVEGYMMTPSASRMTGATAYATFLLEFFTPAGGSTSVSVVASGNLTNGSPADTWIKFGVTNRAPYVGASVSGRVSCALLGGTENYGGQVYFDSVRVSVTTVTVANTTNGTIRNPGFEYSANGTRLSFIDNWQGLGLDGIVDSTYRRTGSQSLKIYVPETLAAQSWPATVGYRYSSQAYAYTPTETEGANLLANGALSLVGPGEAPTSWSSFGDANHMADYWSYVSGTNAWMFWWDGGIYQEITSGFVPGERYKFGGLLYQSSTGLTNGGKYGVIQLEFYNAADGLISTATAYPLINSNTLKGAWFGAAGSASVPADTKKMRVVVRCNVPTSGDGAFTADDIFLKKVPAVAERFTSPFDTHGVVLLQYLDSTGGVLTTYLSPYFTTNSTPGVWTNLIAAGVAPGGTVSGRTVVAILGSSTGFTGALWFDDVSQSLVSTGATQAGLIWNGGFDDGVVGNAYYLSNNLPNWVWLGGSNAGFVVDTASQTTNQSLTIVYPNNLAAQTFPAATGLTYTVEGYMMTPSANRMTGSTAYAQFLLEFFTPAGGVTSVSVVGSAKLTNGTAADTWIKFGVTNRAPYVGAWVTGRVSCAYLDTVGGTVGGQVYFDSVRVTVTTVTVNNTTNGAIKNPGFEYSANGTRLSFIDNWAGLGLDGIIDSTYSRSGSQSLKIFVSETLAAQSWSATQGVRYSSTAYVYTPTETAGSDILVNGALSLVGPGQAPTSWTSFDDGSHEADYWHVLSPTNAWMFYWSGGLYQDVTTGFVPGERYTFGGAFFMDAGNAFTNSKHGVIQLEFYNSTNGLISLANAYPSCDLNSVRGSWFGTAGSATVPADATKMRVIVRCNTPTGNGDGSFTADDIFLKKVPTVAERFTSPFDAHGVVLLQYLNSTGAVLQTYLSPYFTTNSTPGVWTSLMAAGVAPAGTVSGRTLVAILGSSTGFTGALWFDDVSQSAVSTGTVSGLLHNPSFEDGPPGNCFNLYTNHDLPFWTWNGGTNAGYIATDHTRDGQQALVITYPQNGVAQDIAVGTNGHTYAVSGYLFTPSAARFTSDGTSYGWLDLAFYVNGFYVTNYTSQRFTGSIPANQWTNFTVSGTAPATTNVTIRMTCTIFSPNPLNDFELGGVIYFDQLSLNDVSGGGGSPWQDWQVANFGSTNGANTGLYEDYDLDGFLNWNEFVAGTQPTNRNSVWESTASKQSGNNYVIRWPSVAGRYYKVNRSTNFMTTAFTPISGTLAANVPENVYTDSPPTSVALYYYRVSVTTNQP